MSGACVAGNGLEVLGFRSGNRDFLLPKALVRAREASHETQSSVSRGGGVGWPSREKTRGAAIAAERECAGVSLRAGERREVRAPSTARVRFRWEGLARPDALHPLQPLPWRRRAQRFQAWSSRRAHQAARHAAFPEQTLRTKSRGRERPSNEA